MAKNTKIKPSDEVQKDLESLGIDKNSREYKVAFANLVKSNFVEEWYEVFEKSGTISNKDLSAFCEKHKEYGFSENYIRAILVPMILEDFGPVIE